MDKYDEAIEYLTANPCQIRYAWNTVANHEAGCLFGVVGEDWWDVCTPTQHGGSPCGCLTQIKAGELPAYTPELTEAIRADERIPKDPDDIKVSDLPVFAEWQRRIDKELGRV